MSTIKSYTTVEQSRKLAKILPLESADMYYEWPNKKVHFKDDEYSGMGVSCWSLAALFNVLPDELEDNHFLTLQKEKNEYCCCYEGLNNSFRHNTFADNPVDACYEMIIKLKELNLL